MKKGISQILKVQSNQGSIIDISIVQKQSDLGIMFNERLLILIQESSFGYLKGFKHEDDPKSIDTSKCKTLIPLKNVVGDPEKSKNVLGINFYVQQNGKKVSKKWVFKFANQILANQWFALFKNERIKTQAKKVRSGSRSPKKSPLSSHTKVQGSRNTFAEVDNSKSRQQLKKDFVREKSDKNVRKQYQNQLYETQRNKEEPKKTQFILDQPPAANINRKLDYGQKKVQNESKDITKENNNINNPNNTGNVENSKLNNNAYNNNPQNIDKTPYNPPIYEQQNQRNPQPAPNNPQPQQPQPQNNPYRNPVNAQNNPENNPLNNSKYINNQAQIRRYQEQQNFRRQREQLMRKEQQLRQRERRIQQEQFKIQEQKRRIREENDRFVNPNPQPKQTVINQKFFHKGKPEPNPNKEPAPEPNTSKAKPRLQGINYSQIVNKININKNAQKQTDLPQSESVDNKKLQQTYEYLLNEERKKFDKTAQNKMRPEQVIEQDGSQQNYNNVDQLENSKNNQNNYPAPKQFGWTYRFLLYQLDHREHEIVKEFNEHCQNIIRKVVQQFHLPQRKRTYSPKFKCQEYQAYEVDDVQFKIAFISLKQFYNKNGPDYLDKICDQKIVKKFQNQYKNFNILYKSLKQTNAKSLRVPLSCLCQYQGFISIFKAKSQFQKITKVQEKIEKQLKNLSQRLQITNQTFTNKQNVLLLKLNNSYYREIASRTRKFHSNFDFYMIEQIKKLMPTDLLFSSKQAQSQNSAQKNKQTQNIYNVRQQLILNFDFRSQGQQQISSRILQSLRRTSNYKPPKKSSLQSSNIYLQKLSHHILVPLTQIIRQLDNLDFYFIHPKQLQSKLHQSGVNMRYLGLIYQNCSLKFQKCYIMSQIAARVCKTLFRKTIQDVNIEETQQMIQSSYSENIKAKVIDFLNCILGSTVETVTIWKVLSAYSISFFNTPLLLQQIQRGYFVQSLIHQCGIDVDWTQIQMSSAFVTNQFFNQNNFIGINVKIKGYQPFLTSKERQLILAMQQQQPSVFKLLQEQYKLQNNPLPQRFKTQKHVNVFRKYLVNFVPPDFGGQRGYKLLNLYNSESGYSTKTEIYLKFMQLKWYLKRQRKQKYINAFSNINHQITTKFGDFHPLLSQLYDIMCIYHKNNGEFEDAITFSKSSVINMLKVCGTTHQRVGQCYYQLATCCIKGGKKDQAIISLQKAKNIFEANQLQNNLSYANVCLKLGLLFLSESKVKQAENIIKYAQQLFQFHLINNLKAGVQQDYGDERVQCYQILARCYQLQQLAQLQLDLSLQCQKQIVNIKGPNNLQRLLKIILSPILGSLKSNDASAYLDIISQIPLQISVNTYMKGYQRISQRVNQQTLIESLQKYLENLTTIVSFIKSNKILNDWKGLTQNYQRETVNDFISLTEELIYYLGEGFITGSIRDSL